ncbi:MAG: NYN domain-containing protein [Candidatus Woesearchaeota archaeon]
MRSHIFIDGANLYHALKDEGLTIDYAAIPALLARITDSELLRTSFYTGVPENASAERLAFLERLEKIPDFEVKTKPLQRRGDHLIEKGVDVLIATDMLWHGLKGYADHVILVSGDADLVDAITRLMDNGVRVTVAMFERHASRELIKAADRYVDLSEHTNTLSRQDL